MESIPLTAADGATSKARLFRAEEHAASLLVVPAMGVNAWAYTKFAQLLAQAGITTLVMELRGGESSSVQPRKGVDFGYAELLDDVKQHVDELKARAGGPVHLLGHSLGGQMGVVGLSRWYEPGAKLIVIAAGTVHHEAYAGLERVGVFVGTQFAQGLARALGVYPGHRLGFGGKQGKSLIVEWSNAARTGHFVSTRDGSLEQQLDVLAPEVLAIHVQGDTMAPRRTTELLVGKLTKANVKWVDLPPPEQPKRQNPHFRWMKDPANATREIAAFLR